MTQTKRWRLPVSLLALVVGLLVFWFPAVVAIWRGSDGIVPLPPLSLLATVIWIRLIHWFMRVDNLRVTARENMGAILGVAVNMVFFTAIATSVGGSVVKQLFVLSIVWTITIDLLPLGLWYNRRIKLRLKSREIEPPPPRLRDYL